MFNYNKLLQIDYKSQKNNYSYVVTLSTNDLVCVMTNIIDFQVFLALKIKYIIKPPL